MINIAGQLAIKTIPGRYGKFNVGRLATSIGEFVIKNAELDQYDEGKYDGDFLIAEIRPSMYTSGGRMVIELLTDRFVPVIRAWDMTPGSATQGQVLTLR